MQFRNGMPEILPLSQPDIAINYAFIYNQVLLGNTLFTDPLSEQTQQQLHPRSTTVIYNQISPIGFPGIIVLLSILIKPLVLAFGEFSFNLFMVTITPLIAVITPILFYAVLKTFFPKRIALVASVLLYVMPLWWYYAAWPAQHHTWVIASIISALFFAKNAQKKSAGEWRYFYSFLSGISYALAIFLRPTEALWLIPVLIVFVYTKKKKIHWKYHILPFCCAAILMAIAFFITQVHYYGHALGSGYVIPQSTGAGGSIVASALFDSPVISLIAPFGIHPLAIIKNTYQYLVTLVFPWTILTIIGIYYTIIIKNPRATKRSRTYLFFVASISTFLLIYYGSATFFDTPLGDVPTIGTSFTRYFLFIYVFSLPFVARALFSLIQFFKKPVRLPVLGCMIMVLGIHGYITTYKHVDGLEMLKGNIAQFYNERDQVLTNTWPNSVIITDSADKYLFPYRRVITTASYEREKSQSAISTLLDQGIPVYWYNHVSSGKTDVEQEINKQFTNAPFHITESMWAGYDMQLRRIEKKP